MLQDGPDIADCARTPAFTTPVHWTACDTEVCWSTVNAGEAMPGVVTPLSWSFFSDALERAMKGTFFDMGVLRRDEVLASPRHEDRLLGIFYGRAAGNLTMFRYIGDRTPGTSADAIEAQIFGQVRPGVSSHPIYRRYPFVAARAPWAATHMAARLRASTGPIREWWQQMVRPGAIDSPATARATLADAAARFEAVMRPHTLAAMLCQGTFDQLSQIARAAGRPGLELTLATGYGDMAETAVVSDLWEVSRNRLTLDEFVARHGFHGPSEGEFAARVWRIRRAPLEGLLESYRDLDEARAPRQVERERGAARIRAEVELLGGLSGARRLQARVILKLAAHFIPQRGIGKAAFLRCIDVGRECARMLGGDLVRQGCLEQAEDVFMLTVPELLADPSAVDIRALADARRAQQNELEQLDVPDIFTGVPSPIRLDREREAVSIEEPISGAPVSAGVVEGVARVILDPEGGDEFEPGEILVCHTTDPSWASIMMLAQALVIDIGGPISHGAIVARELGVPCVIGTRDGTGRIRTGDRLRVDGGRGQVQVLGRAAAAPVTADQIPTS